MSRGGSLYNWLVGLRFSGLVLTGWSAGLGPVTNSLKEENPSGCHQHLFPQEEVPVASWLWETSPRSVNESTWISLKLLYYLFTGLEVCETLCVPFKSTISVSYTHLALLHANPAGLQNQMFGGSSSQYRTPGWRSQCWSWPPSCFGRTTAILTIFLLVGCLPGSGCRVGCLTYIVSLPLLPVSSWFLLYKFSCRKSFLLVSRLFSLIAVW